MAFTKQLPQSYKEKEPCQDSCFVSFTHAGQSPSASRSVRGEEACDNGNCWQGTGVSSLGLDLGGLSVIMPGGSFMTSVLLSVCVMLQ